MGLCVRTLVLVGLASVGLACSSSSSEAPAEDAGTGDFDAGPSIPPGPPCGRNATLCAPGGDCEGAADCTTATCREGKCQDITPADGTKNGDETDVDCGGTKAPACADGKGCSIKDDCTSQVCTAGVCQAPSPKDGVKNGDETGTDCGGSKAPKCPTGQGCKADADCNNVKCDPNTKLCASPAHDDGFKNGDETGVDCGGPTATLKCPTGDGCAATSDCDKALCNDTTKVCDPPSKADGIKNGTETDIDCGGGAPTNADRCVLAKTCVVDGDCGSVACNYAKKCIEAPSCRPQYGGDTCGKGEVEQAGHVHESCCKSVALANNSVRVDKYEITAGRMREFVRSVGNNVQGWVSAHRDITQQIPDSLVSYLPLSATTPVKPFMQCNPDGTNCANNPNVQFGTNMYLGNTVFMKDRPCPNCGQGCYIGDAASHGYGHPTYYWPNGDPGLFGSQPRAFTQAQLDVKALNCTPELLFAAFCAWDGGRLPTAEELSKYESGANSAWGASTYPWGNQTPADTTVGAAAPGRMAYPNDTNWFLVRAFGSGVSNLDAAMQYNWTNFNPFGWYVPNMRYGWPYVPSVNWDQTDQAYVIAAPGRFYNDFHARGPGEDGWYDIASNLMEVTATLVYTDDANHNSLPAYAWSGGSFEGHGIGRAGGTQGNGQNHGALTKYGKMGARCVRPM